MKVLENVPQKIIKLHAYKLQYDRKVQYNRVIIIMVQYEQGHNYKVQGHNYKVQDHNYKVQGHNNKVIRYSMVWVLRHSMNRVIIEHFILYLVMGNTRSLLN